MSEIYCNPENLQILLNRVNNSYPDILLPIAYFGIGEKSRALNAFVNAYETIYNITVDYCSLVRQDLGSICNIINSCIETDSGIGGDISRDNMNISKVEVVSSLDESSCWKENVTSWNVSSFNISFDNIDTLMSEFDTRLSCLRSSIDSYKGEVNLLANTEAFEGESADSVKLYLSDVNMKLAEAVALLGEELKELLVKYWLCYKDELGEINSYVFDEQSMSDVKDFLNKEYGDLIEEAYNCDSLIRNSKYISVISSLTLPDSGDLFESFYDLIGLLGNLMDGVSASDIQWERVVQSFITEQCDMVAQQITTFRNRARKSVGEYVPGTCDSIEGYTNFQYWLEAVSEHVNNNRDSIEKLYECENNISELADEMQRDREELINTLEGVKIIGESVLWFTITVATMGAAAPTGGVLIETCKDVFVVLAGIRQESNFVEALQMIGCGISSDDAINVLTDKILQGDETAITIYDLVTAGFGLVVILGPGLEGLANEISDYSIINDITASQLSEVMGVPVNGAYNYLEYLDALGECGYLTSEEIELLNSAIIGNVVNGEVDVVGVLNTLAENGLCSENVLKSAELLFDTNILQATGYYVGGATEMTPILIDDTVIIGGTDITSVVPTTNIGNITGNIIIDDGIVVPIDNGNVLIDQPVSVIINFGEAIGTAGGSSGGTDIPQPPLTVGEIDTIGNASGGESVGNTGISISSFTAADVPSIRNGCFNDFFNSLSVDDLNLLWDNPEIRETIESRLRSPGGFHEWLLVSRTPKFKSWGVTAEQIRELRTQTSDVRFVNPNGVHGGRGSTMAHNEILNIIDSSEDYYTFVKRLNEWANMRLEGGSKSLPEGLQIGGI